MLAAKYGNIGVMEVLMENGAHINAKNKNGLKAEDFARAYGQAEAYQVLTKR